MKALLLALSTLAAMPLLSPVVEPTPRCADVTDLVLWRGQVSPGRPLLETLAARLPDGPTLTLQGDQLLFRGDEADLEAVQTMLAQVRGEASRRELARAADNRASLLNLDGEQAGSVLLKATWTGLQSEPVPGLAVHGTKRLFTVMPFRTFRRAGLHYGNDDLASFRSFTASDEELAALIRTVLEQPICVEAMQREQARDWSLTLIDTTGAGRPGHLELLLDRDEAAVVFRAMRAATEANPLAQRVLAEMR